MDIWGRYSPSSTSWVKILSSGRALYHHSGKEKVELKHKLRRRGGLTERERNERNGTRLKLAVQGSKRSTRN